VEKPGQRLTHRSIVIDDEDGRLVRVFNPLCRGIMLPYHGHSSSAGAIKQQPATPQHLGLADFNIVT
jgi:hypothetical protein